MKQSKNCSNCKKGIALNLTKDILCKYHGVVTPDYVCFKYKPNSETTHEKKIEYKCIHCENFLVKLDSPSENIGKCKLFSAREFDGCSRNTCSKFAKKLLIDVC